MKHFIFFLLLYPLLASGQDFPKKPTNYVTDNANILTQREQELLNVKLRAFEDSTSNQLFIYLDDRYNTDLEDYSKKIFNTWGIGQKDKNNGILIAIFVRDREYRIQVGFGLEAALSAELCRQIQDEHMGPHFKENNFYEGINAGVDKLIYYSRHEYKPPSPLEKMQTPLLVASLAGLVLFVINLFSVKKWNNQPRRKGKYLLLSILFLAIPVALTIAISFFSAIESFYILLPVFLGTFAQLLLCVTINDKDEIKYDNETDSAYERRMRMERDRSSNSSDDNFSGGGGGDSDRGGSSSSW